MLPSVSKREGVNIKEPLPSFFMWGQTARAHSPKIFHPLGMGLDEQALKVVSMWRFEPARKLDQPVPAKMSVETSFNLY